SDYFSDEDTLIFASNYGISGTFANSTGTLHLTGNASLADYSSALQEVYYQNTDSTPTDSTRTLSFSVSDGIDYSNVATRDITIGADNSAPVLASIEGTTIAYTDGDPETNITSALTISDADDYYLDSAWVTISNNYVNGEDYLDFTSVYGITPSWSSVSGELQLVGSASLTEYQTALRSVSYDNLNPDPDGSTRTIQFKVSDGEAHSNSLSRDLSVTPVNDAPVLANLEESVIVYNEGDGAISITDSITVSDGDDTKLDSVTIQITGNYFVNEDSLGYSTIFGLSGTWYRGAGKLVLDGLKSLSVYQSAIRSVIYENVGADPQTPTRTLTFIAYDSDSASTPVTRLIASGVPATISNLDLWLNSTSGVYSDVGGTIDAIDGDDVEVWKDQSGNGRDFVAGVKNPVWRSSVASLNGESSLEWAINNTHMEDADGENYINGLTEFTIFFVVESDVTSADNGLWMVDNGVGGDQYFTVRYDAVGDNSSELNVIKTAILSNVSANELESHHDMQSTDPQVICLDWKSGNTWRMYVDGVLNSVSYLGSPPTGTISNAVTAILGEGPEGEWDGMIAEVILYGRHLSDTERIQVEDYISDKYAISVRLLEPATGGEAISADDANTAWTTLAGPRFTEDYVGQLALNGTGELLIPDGFEWNPLATPTVTTQPAYGTTTSLSVAYNSYTDSSVIFTINAVSTAASQPGEVIITGLQVRPTTATVPNTGEIYNIGTTGGVEQVSYGTLTMVAGIPSAVIYSEAPPASGTKNEPLTPTITAEIQDANGNTIETSGTTISMALSYSDTPGAGLRGTTSLNTDAYGQVAFTDLAIDTTGLFLLTASSSGITSAVSDTCTVTNPGQYTTFLVEKVSGGNILTQTAGVEFNIKISAVDGTTTADTNFASMVTLTSSGNLSTGGGITPVFNRGILSPDTVSINAIGNFTISATDTSGKIVGISNTFSVVSGPASEETSLITATPTVLENDAVSTSTITVQIKDAGGNDHASGGETVNLITTAGALLGSVTDNGDGTYIQLLQSSSSVDQAVITGVLNGKNMTDRATVNFNAYTNIWESDPGTNPYTTRWDTLVNWDAGSIPTSSDAILIPATPADGTRYPIISTDGVVISSLTLESGADLTLSGGIVFEVEGDVLGGGDINGSSSDTLRVGGDLGLASATVKYVEFNGTSTQFITSPLTFSNVTINNSAGVEVADNVEITETLTLENGSLIIESGKSLIANTKVVSGGSIKVKRDIIGSTGWRMYSSPVASTYGDLFGEIFTQGYGGSDSSSGSPSVLWYDETYAGTDNQRWRKPDTTSDATVPGRGLFVYVFGSIPGEADYSQSLPATIDVTGTEAEGTSGEFDFGVSYTALADTGWNLIGNPFVATIDWDHAGWTKTNIDNVIYVWDVTANSGEGAYLTWNGTTGSLGNGLIMPFQGFWVKANADSPILKVPLAAKTTGGVFYKHSSESNPLIILLLEADTLGSTAHIQFNESGSINKDNRDAYYLVPPADTYVELYTEGSDNSYLSIQSHPYRFGRVRHIPIHVNGYVDGNPLSGSYRLSWPRVQDMHPEWTLILEDLETGAEVDLKTQNFYEFEHSSLGKKPLESLQPSKALTRTKPFQLLKKSGGDSPRFLLRIDPGGAFPEIPREFALGQNYPNPFNAGTIIPFAIPLEAKVSATIFDLRGRVADVLVEDKTYDAGQHTLNWLARGRSSGIYFCNMQIGNRYFTKKMILLR
nr:T9SS type A sorting domain-containing protein [FCB group bacterium]